MTRSDRIQVLKNAIDVYENLSKLPASCQEIRDNQIFDEKDGIWLIQPHLDFEPFHVNCSFPTDLKLPAETILKPKTSGYGYTSLPNSSSGCHDPGCYQGERNSYILQYILYSYKLIINLNNIFD